MNLRALPARLLPQLAARRRLWVVLAAVLAVYALLGFALVPWLVKRELPGLVAENLAATASVERVRFNPFALSAELHGLALADVQGVEVARLGLLRVNLQLSSLVRRALVLRELRLDGLAVRMVRDAEGKLNVAQLVKPSAEPAPAPATESAGLFPIVIDSLALNGAAVDLRDEQRATPFETRFGPLDVAVSNLSTLPDRQGRQQVQLTLAEGATIGWRGSLQLEPLHSDGFLEVRGPHLALAQRYLADQLPVSLAGGDLDLSLAYRVDARRGGELVAAISGLSLGLFDLRVATREGREFFRLPSLRLTGGSLRWPGKAVGITSVVVSGVSVDAVRNPDGTLDLTQLLAAPADGAEPAEEAVPAPSPEPAEPFGGWDFRLGELRVEEMRLALEDRSVSPAAKLGVSDLDLSLRNVSSRDGEKMPVTAFLALASGGKLGARGELVAFPAVDLAADVSVDGLALAVAQPYVAQFARVEIESGSLGLGGKLVSNPEETLGFRGHFAIDEFDLRDTGANQRLASLGKLDVSDLSLSLSKSALELLQVVLTRPYARVHIAKDKSTNVGAVMVEQKEEPAAATESEPGFAVKIARVRIEGGGADFSDLSLPLPFAAKIHRLRGVIGPVATQTRTPAQIKLDGQVGEYGLMQLSGSTRIDDPLDLTKLKLSFRNVDMPTFSGYSADFAGRKIESGKLELALGYDIEKRQLTATNRLVLSDFELGERVESPNATSLPLDLALALLRTPEGKIDIELPVSGNVDDPEFGYGSVIWKALVNLLLKIVASPFNLLAGLMGMESEELGNIEFAHGSAELLPPEQEKIAKLIEALAQRPQLVLEAPAVVDPKADSLMLQDAAVNLRIVAALGTDAPTAENLRDVMEDLWEDAFPDAELDDLEAKHQTADAELDEVAYLVALRRELAAQEPLAPGALDALAQQRAAAVIAAVTADGRIPAARAVAKERKDVEAKAEWVPMGLALAAGPAAPAPASALDAGLSSEGAPEPGP